MVRLVSVLPILVILASPLFAAEGKKETKRLDDLIKQLKTGPFRSRSAAAIAIQGMGPKAKRAIPVLLEITLNSSENFNMHSRTVSSLTAIGVAARPALLKAVREGTAYVRRISAGALGGMGIEAVPALIKALQDPDRNVKLIAIQSLGSIGPKAKKAIPALQKIAKTARYTQAAARSLWHIRRSGKPKASVFAKGKSDRGLAAFVRCSGKRFEVGEPIAISYGFVAVGSDPRSIVKVYRPIPAVDPQNASWFNVTTAKGGKVRYQGPYISFGFPRGTPDIDSIVALRPGEFCGRTSNDLSFFYSLLAPGKYKLSWGTSSFPGKGLWSGKLTSNTIEFTIVAPRP